MGDLGAMFYDPTKADLKYLTKEADPIQALKEHITRKIQEHKALKKENPYAPK